MEEKADLSLSARILTFFKENIPFSSLILLGIILVVAGIFQYFYSKNGKSGVEFVAADSADIKESSASATFISVDIEGQVQHPGVYKVSDGARLQDALIAAGGMNTSADREYISKHLNLAQKVVDGGKIYIPGIDEKTTDTAVSN